MIIDEEKIRQLVKEELGIAVNVIRIVNIIEDNIMNSYNNGLYTLMFIVDDLKVVFKHIFVKNVSELSNINLKNGYSFKENTVYLTNASVIGETIDLKPLIDTIQHEVLHYWECKNSGKKIITSKYEAVVNGLSSNIGAISLLSRLFYLNNKFELDAYVNGAFNVLRKVNCGTYKELIENTELKKLFKMISDIKNEINDDNFYQNIDFIFAKNYFSQNNICKKLTKKNLLLIVSEIENYLYKKIGKMWVYYVKTNKKDLTVEEFNNMSSLEKKLYLNSKYLEGNKLNGIKDDLLF